MKFDRARRQGGRARGCSSIRNFGSSLRRMREALVLGLRRNLPSADGARSIGRDGAVGLLCRVVCLRLSQSIKRMNRHPSALPVKGRESAKAQEQRRTRRCCNGGWGPTLLNSQRRGKRCHPVLSATMLAVHLGPQLLEPAGGSCAYRRRGRAGARRNFGHAQALEVMPQRRAVRLLQLHDQGNKALVDFGRCHHVGGGLQGLGTCTALFSILAGTGGLTLVCRQMANDLSQPSPGGADLPRPLF